MAEADSRFLRAYTWGSVLSHDITKVAPRDVRHTEVLLTIVGGNTLYENQ
ncbi:MAG: hypothetical protein ACRD35_06750 [Candidatus Acidiferrales bacterium]